MTESAPLVHQGTARPYKNGVTIGIVAAGNLADVAERMEARHAGEHDAVLVFVPKGKAQDARDRIWKALDEAPRQDPREFELDQATAYEGNISRMYGSL